MTAKTLAEAVKILKRGGIGVLPTDTIYGLVGSALSRNTVERVYQARKRNPSKPFIILIGSVEDLKLFGIHLEADEKKLAGVLWPGPVSIIFPCQGGEFYYLHRGKKKLAFRLPKPIWLRNLIKKTGPLVAPSANPEGLEPARNLEEARVYFGDNSDFYVAGTSKIKASTLVEIKRGRVLVLRQGEAKIPKNIIVK